MRPGGGGGGGALMRRMEEKAWMGELGPRDPLLHEFTAEAATMQPGDGGGGFGAPASRTLAIEPDNANSFPGLEALYKFLSTSDALSAATVVIDSDRLLKFLQKHCEAKSFTVADSQLANAIKDKLMGKRSINVPELEAGTKRSLAGMEHPAKRTRGEGSSSGAAQSSAPGSSMEAEAADVPFPHDVHVQPEDAQADAVPALHPPLPHVYGEYDELVLQVKRSVVTVSAMSSKPSAKFREYRTGIIVSSTEQFAIIYTSITSEEQGHAKYFYHVHMEEDLGVIAKLLVKEEPSRGYCTLIVPTDKKHQSVSFLYTPLTYQRVFTLGAMAGTQLRSDRPAVDALIGKLAQFDGRVLTRTCSARTLHYKHVQGSEDYFEVKCLARDDIVQLKYIDNREHKATRLHSAPIFDLNGRVVGLIDKAGTYVDVKNGFKAMISSMISMCGKKNWQQGLLDLGHEMYPKLFGNA